MAWADFTTEDYKFFMNEFGYNREKIDSMSEAEQSDLYNICLDIEIEETPATNSDTFSKRGEMAVRLVNLIWNPGQNDPKIIAEYNTEMASYDTDKSAYTAQAV